MWEGVGMAYRWKHPKDPPVRKIFNDERATDAVLAFLQDTKVGRTIPLAPPEQAGGGRTRASEEGPDPP